MKKILTFALAAAMTVAMGVTSFADTARLGNYVISKDEITTTTDEEMPEEENQAQNTTPSTEVTPAKQNPNTGAIDFSGLGITAVVLTAAGILIARKK